MRLDTNVKIAFVHTVWRILSNSGDSSLVGSSISAAGCSEDGPADAGSATARMLPVLDNRRAPSAPKFDLSRIPAAAGRGDMLLARRHATAGACSAVPTRLIATRIAPQATRAPVLAMYSIA